jgi:pimeloyl-ACP methyl ester carboxylesterase
MQRASAALSATGLVVAIAAASCSPAPHGDAWTDSSPHRVSYVTVNTLRLQYLDWGGTGEPVVFVHGSGDSPHYFDEIAPALVAHHRIIAPARRGHGQSEAPAAPFSLDDLTDDLVGLLDALHVEKAALIGFSFGGNEITRFAERYPHRVSRLVYLDAAFERSQPDQVAVFDRLPSSPSPTPSDLRSLASFRQFARRVWYPGVAWSQTMEAVFRDFSAVAPNGSVTIPSDRAAASMEALEATYRRNYSAITCPVLAILPEFYELAPEGADAGTRAAIAQWHSADFVPYQRAVIETLTREIPGVRIVRLSGLAHNALPVTARAEIIAELQKFMAAGSTTPASEQRP